VIKGEQVARPAFKEVINMEEGSIIHIDYTLYNAESGDVIETTLEEIAKKNEMVDENKTYEPLVTVIGDGRLIKGFEEHLKEADADTDYDFDIPPLEGYGERDPELVETIGQGSLMRQVRDPDSLVIGGPVEIGGRTGVIQMVQAGRARVDFNHPLAGKTLRYEYKIVKVIEDRTEKVQTLLKSTTGRDDFEVEFDGDDATITLPEMVSYDHNWAMAKFGLIRAMRDHVGVKTVVLREVHQAREVAEGDEESHDHDHDHDHDHSHNEEE
jgi:FKBP-type peptidyl-prolyl cis-trans isomerase 2